MADDIFTHTFEFNMDGVEVKGDVEFDSDKEVSMDIKQSGIPLKADTLQLILDFFNIIRNITELSGGVKLIKIKEKAE